MNDRSLRLGIVGCGAAAHECHLPGLALAPDIELAALVDPNRMNAERLAGKYGGPSPRIAADVASVVGHIDAAIIASPHDTHEALTVELANAGVHCLVEKPMALSVRACDQMAAAARASGVVLAVAHVRRLFAASPWVRAKLQAGALGETRRVDWKEGGPYDWPLASPSLFDAAASGGGVLSDGGPHVFDLLMWWLGDDFTVRRYRDSSLGGAESEAEVALSIGGVDVDVIFSRLRLMRNTCVIEGTEGSLEVGIDVEAPYTLRDSAGHVVETGIVEAVPPTQAEWPRLFTEQLRNFAAAIRGEEAAYAGADDGRRTVDLIHACYAVKESLPTPWREWEEG